MPLSCPPPPSTGRDYIQGEQATSRAKLERTKWLTGEEVTIPLSGPQFLPSIYCPYPEGGTVGPGIFSRAPHLPVAAVEGPEGGGEGWEAPSQPGCPGPGSGGGGSGGAAWAVPESEPGEVGSGHPAGLGVGTGVAAMPVGGGPERGASAPGGCSVGVAACMIFWRTSRIFNCRHTLDGKMSA